MEFEKIIKYEKTFPAFAVLLLFSGIFILVLSE